MDSTTTLADFSTLYNMVSFGLGVLLLRIITYNIRFASTDPSGGERPWEGVRAPRVISQLRFNTINNPEALIGMQEVLSNQLTDIVNGLNEDRAAAEPEWAFIGVGRDDGKKAGEFSPILYRPSVWRLEDWTTIWLSETPNVPGSKGWDAGSVRILTIGNFQHRASGKRIVAMNTHFDNSGTISRANSARIVSEEIRKRQQRKTWFGSQPAILLTGDFNSQPDQEAYQFLTQESSPVFDARQSIPEERRYGNRIGTFSGFSEQVPTLLDYIFLNKAGSWAVKTYAVLANIYDEGVYYSDHQPVVIDVELGGRK